MRGKTFFVKCEYDATTGWSDEIPTCASYIRRLSGFGGCGCLNTYGCLTQITVLTSETGKYQYIYQQLLTAHKNSTA